MNATPEIDHFRQIDELAERFRLHAAFDTRAQSACWHATGIVGTCTTSSRYSAADYQTLLAWCNERQDALVAAKAAAIAKARQT